MSFVTGRIREVAKDLIAGLHWLTGASRLHRMPPSCWLILTFHRVLPDELRRSYPLPWLAVTPVELRWILSAIVPDFEVLPASEACEALDMPRKKPLLSVTFDDGQWDNFQFGAPVLDELGVKASFYVPTDYIGTDELLWHDLAAFAWQKAESESAQRAWLDELAAASGVAIDADSNIHTFLALLKRVPREVRERLMVNSSVVGETPDWARMMSWDEVSSLRNCGHEIGSHGASHSILPLLSSEDLMREVDGSRQVIAARLGEHPRGFCFPNGDYSDDVISSVKSAGYANSVSTRWGINASGDPKLDLKRCDMSIGPLISATGRLSRSRLCWRLSGLHPGLRAS